MRGFKNIALFIVLIFLLLINGAGILAIPTFSKIYTDVTDLKKIYDEASVLRKQDYHSLDPQEISNLVARLALSVGKLDDDFHPLYPVLETISVVPVLGKYAGQVQPLIKYGVSMTRAGMAVSLAVSSNWARTSFELPVYTRAFNILYYGEPYLKAAKINLEEAALYRNKINLALFPSLSSSITKDWEKVGEYSDQYLNAMQFLDPILNAMGANKPQTYIMLIQNRDELRATGGFITAFGVIRLEKGFLSILLVQNSGDLQAIQEFYDAPKPMKNLMAAGYWVTRDANWSPDFPTSARDIQKLYYLQTGIPTDGVIAINQGTIRDLLKLTGPVNLISEGEVITENNLEDYMIKYKMTALQTSQPNYKEFMVDLYPPLVRQLQAIKFPEEISKLKGLYDDLTAGGYLLVYNNDPQIQGIIEKFGLAGKVVPGNGDFLMVVDSNLGFNKLDSLVNKVFSYSVDLADPSNPVSIVHLNYENPIRDADSCQERGFTDPIKCDYYKYMREVCDSVRCVDDGNGMAVPGYFNYWRVLKSSEDTLTSSTIPEIPSSYIRKEQNWPGGLDTMTDSGGTTEYGGLAIVKPETSNDVYLGFKLAPQVISRTGDQLTYFLKVQNQPGINNVELHIQIKAPRGYLVSSPPEGWKVDESKQSIEWNGILNRPVDLQVEFVPLPDNSPTNSN